MHLPSFTQLAGSALLCISALALPLPALAAPTGNRSGNDNGNGSNTATPQGNTRQLATATVSTIHGLPPLPETFAEANRQLHAQTKKLRGSARVLSAGEPVPAFALYDQSGNAVLVPEQWRGKHVVVNFIFTRCRVANMCPAATARMTALQRSLAEKGFAEKVQLVSISFDPRYDSPQVLTQYAGMFAADPANYSFLTGEEATIADVLHRFGVLTRKEDGTINHSMVTALISPDGKVALRQNGPDWSAEQILEQIQAEAATAH